MATSQGKLYVWLLDTDSTFNIEISAINTTTMSKYITSCEDQIGTVTNENNVKVWSPNNTQEIYIAPTDPVPEAVLFHPTSRGGIMLVSSENIHSQDLSDDSIFRLHICEYVNGAAGNSCSIDMPLLRRLRAGDEPVGFDIRPIDDNLIYSICWVFGHIIDLSKLPHACREKRHNGNVFDHLLCYDISRKEWTLRCFLAEMSAKGTDGTNEPLQSPPQEFCSYSQVWAGRMLTPVIGAGSTSRQFLFRAVTALDQVSLDPPAVHLIDGIGCPTNAVSCNDHEEIPAEGLLFYVTFESEIQPTRQRWNWVNWSRIIRGDKEFLVVLAEERYIVWCLDKSVNLPPIGQLPEENLVYTLD